MVGSDKGEIETKYEILGSGFKGFCCEKIEFEEEDLGLGLRLSVMKEAYDK